MKKSKVLHCIAGFFLLAVTSCGQQINDVVSKFNVLIINGFFRVKSLTMRALICYCYLPFFVFTVLVTGCSSEKAIQKFPEGVVQEPINQKRFDGKDYDQAYLLTVKSSGDRIFWFEKYKSGNKSNGLSDYLG